MNQKEAPHFTKEWLLSALSYVRRDFEATITQSVNDDRALIRLQTAQNLGLDTIAHDAITAIDQAIDTMDWIIWSLFGLDLLLKTYLSENRLRYLRQHPFDVLVVLLPFLRPLKILRTLGSVRTLRLIRVFVNNVVGHRKSIK